eukprot:comp22887_c0_seq1/m.36177 comp22887_c0_seq1/g.36177  ORF comp22887_c0_seq1/g.36177 comp22887_c0_seq1/m.36177 type:complete len:340 (-) comp22887_c0_seq1:692-1711(-)
MEHLRICGLDIKYISLITLVLQNTAQALVMRYSRTAGGDMYIASTAVVMGELLKLLTCFVLLMFENNHDSRRVIRQLKEEIIDKPGETMKLAVPAGLYMVQNNLQFVAASNLDAATFQITYQLKIFTTAVFSVLMLNKKLTNLKWLSLVVLMAGVGLVQIAADSKGGHTQGNSWVGLFAVLSACMTSGFAGVYFEKILKGSTTSVWVRNVQLALFGGGLGLVAVWWNDGAAVSEKGFFFGYYSIVWVVVAINSLGGLITAVVVKYADNILKAFATSVAIVLSTILSVLFMGFQVSLLFIFGAGLVMGAVYLYGKPDPPQKPVLPMSAMEDRDVDDRPMK